MCSTVTDFNCCKITFRILKKKLFLDADGTVVQECTTPPFVYRHEAIPLHALSFMRPSPQLLQIAGVGSTWEWGYTDVLAKWTEASKGGIQVIYSTDRYYQLKCVHRTNNRGSTEMKGWNCQQLGYRHSDSFILCNESQRVRILSNERDDVIKWTHSGLISS